MPPRKKQSSGLPDEAFKEEDWIYIGQRQDGDTTRLATAWLDGEGKQRAFTAIKAGGRIIGGHYGMLVARQDESLWLRGGPRFLGKATERGDRVAGWEVEERAAKIRIEQQRAERDAGRKSALDGALARLEQVAQTCRTRDELDALTVLTMRRLYEAWDTRPLRTTSTGKVSY